MPEVHFEKARGDPSGRHQLHIAVRDKSDSRHDRLIEALPAMECHLRNRDGSVSECTIDSVHRELVPDKVVGDKNGILRTARTSEGNLSCLRTFLRQGIERFSAAPGAEEKSSEHSGTVECKQPGICA